MSFKSVEQECETVFWPIVFAFVCAFGLATSKQFSWNDVNLIPARDQLPECGTRKNYFVLRPWQLLHTKLGRSCAGCGAAASKQCQLAAGPSQA